MKSMTFLQKLSLRLAYLLCRSLHASYRYRWYDLSHYQAAVTSSERGNPAIACWHQNTLPAVLAHAHRNLAVIVSQSFDGEVIASVAERFGIAGARGSSHRGGREALRAALHFAKAGKELGITVDGPTGPRHEIKPGIFYIAARSKMSILPLAAVGRSRWILSKTWDQFHIPKPFSIVDCVYGEPIEVPASLTDADIEQLSKNLHDALQKLERQIADWQQSRAWPKPERR